MKNPATHRPGADMHNPFTMSLLQRLYAGKIVIVRLRNGQLRHLFWHVGDDGMRFTDNKASLFWNNDGTSTLRPEFDIMADEG